MKKYFKMLFISFFAIIFCSGFCFIFSEKSNCKNVYADEELPVYFSASIYQKNEAGDSTKLDDEILQNDTVLLDKNQYLRITLGDPDFNNDYAISSFPMTITVDGVTKSIKSDYIKTNNSALKDANYVDIALDPFSLSDADSEGRYSIYFSYMEYSGTEYSISTRKSFTFTFFLFKQSSYITANLPAVSISNVETTIAGNSVQYARTHQFHYTNSTTSQRLNLPTIVYDYNKFELRITKSLYNINEETYVSIDTEGNLVQTGDIVKILQDTALNQAQITFNDIGNYKIEYIFIHRNNEQKFYLNDLTNNTKFDRLNIFGIQLFHADINSVSGNNKSEFKLFNQSNLLISGKQTDITYTGFDDSNIIQNGTDFSISNIADISEIPSTNQAPVELDYNATILKDKSYYFTYNSDSDLWTKHENYTGTAFTEVGTYLVKTTYTSSNAIDTSKQYVQWFLFKIENNTPSFSISDENDNLLASNNWTNQNVTVKFNDVENPFNSATQLIVYSKNFEESTYTNPTIVDGSSIFTESKNYKVIAYFGKNLQKQIVSYFSIDNTPITGITARTVESFGGGFVKKSSVDFFSNQNIVIEWNEKSDKTNTTKAYYKYIPITKTQTSWTTSILESYYTQGKYIPVDYLVETKNNFVQINYDNNSNSNFVSSENILTENGMYIFLITDLAGNYSYQAFVIDKTNPVILQKITSTGTIITDLSSLNITAEDSTILWGQYKVIKFDIEVKNYNTTTWEPKSQQTSELDPWLKVILSQNASYQQMTSDPKCNFTTITTNAKENLYLASEIDTSNITVQINGKNFNISNSNLNGGEIIDDFSYQINVVKDSFLYEDTYTFYISDESNTTETYQSTLNIQISTDISKTSVRFEENGNYLSLEKHSYEKTDTEESLKSLHYYPINLNSNEYSNQCLELQYLITPTINTIELESIKVEFYPYVTDYLIYTPSNTQLISDQKNVNVTKNETYELVDQLQYLGQTNSDFTQYAYYTLEYYFEKNILDKNSFTNGSSYTLSKQSQIISVYDYDKSINLGKLDNGFYLYQINTIYDSQTENYYTQEGKYIITRKYKNFGTDTTELVGSKYDYMTREIVFFVDRQNIVSSPESITSNNESELISRIGGEIYLEVLSGSDDAKQFKHIYRANSFTNSNTITYLLETNMLPVKLYLPLYKIGQMVGEDYIVSKNILFFDDNISSYIDSNQLKVAITNTSSGDTITSNVSYKIQSEKPATGQVYTQHGNQYIVWDGIDKSTNMIVSLDSFSTVGEWKITISQNNEMLKGYTPSLTFYIKIQSETPEFELLNTNGSELVYFNNAYWTNSNKIRVQWTDSSNEYIAKIDQSDILCYANGNFFFQPTAETIITASNGKTHYFDLDISSYSHGTQIQVTLHYQGDKSYYPENSWSITKQIYIDKIAPVESIENLIAFANEPSLINTISLREGHGQSVGYNKSTTEGLFKNYAFAVDKSQFAELIWSSSDKTSVYYRQVKNKYIDNTITELNPQSSDAISQLVYSGQYTLINNLNDVFNDWTTNTYYEIVEIDFAQNITVYTIYYCDIQSINIDDNSNNNHKAVYYSDSVNKYSIGTSAIANTNYSFVITSKDNFVLNELNAYDYKWAILTFGTQKYVFSPFDLENGQVYKYNLNQNKKVYLYNEFNLSPANADYIFTIHNIPCQSITIAVALTDKDLTFTHPSRENAYFQITAQQITSSTSLDWQYIEVWEYINNQPNKYAKFETGNTEPIETLNPDSFDIAQISQNSNITLFEIKKPYAGAQYRYKITDNFGCVYVFQHLYGQEYIDEIKTYDGLISPLKFDFEDEETYLSTQKISYNYYFGVTSASVQVIEYNLDGSFKSNKTYKIDPTTLDTYGNYFEVTTYGSYATISLKPVNEDQLENGYYGGIRLFIITSKTTIEVNNTDPSKNIDETTVNRFMLYNLKPQINLKGKNRQNLNGLFDSGDNMTSDPVTIEFSDTSTNIFPCNINLMYPDGSIKEIQSGETVSDVGEYKIVLSWTKEMDCYKSSTYSFKISSDAWQYYVVEILEDDGLYHEVDTTGTPYSSTNNVSYNNHYIVNTASYKIRTNQTQLIDCVYVSSDVKSGVKTYIYEISNYGKNQEFLNYFKTTIAVTVIPESNKLVSDFYYLDTEGIRHNFEFSQESFVISKDFENSDYVIVSWNPYYKIEENTISAEILYGENNTKINFENISLDKNIFQIKLTESGAYIFKFKDLAGNTHLFDFNAQITNTTSAFEFIFLDNVVFTVNDQSPIQYAIYNDAVEIKIPQYTVGYYDNNAKPSIVVLRNGIEYTNFKVSSSERKWTFDEPGLYQITWEAKKDNKEIRQEKFYFQIISANELVWAFNIESYKDYYIKQIFKNNIDVTETMVEQNLGNLKLVQTVDENQQVVDKYYLTNLFISLYDELTGSGFYTVTIVTGNEFNQEFTYSFRVNNANPPIEISLAEGESTTDEIIVKFNAYNLYQEVGDCILRISGNEDLILNSSYFEKADAQELYEIKLTSVREYFIQLLTPSERLLFTYKVTRTQPLNAVAIILIIVSSIVVVGGLVIFILLRKRMKIR